MGEFRRAIEDYDTAISLDSNDADAYLNRGVAYFSMGEFPPGDRGLRYSHQPRLQ